MAFINLKNILIITSILFAALFYSCEQTIDLEIPAQEEKLVIFGMINNSNVPFVTVTKTVNIYDYQSQSEYGLNPIINATLKVYNSTDTLTLSEPTFNESGLAVFFFPAVFNVEPGQTYNMEITADGKTVTAQTIVPIQLQVSNINVNFDTITEFDYTYVSSYVSCNIENLDFAVGGLQTKTTLEYLGYEQQFDTITYELNYVEDSIQRQQRFSLFINEQFMEDTYNSNFYLPSYYQDNFSISIYEEYGNITTDTIWQEKPPEVEFNLTFTTTHFNKDLVTYFNSVQNQNATLNNPFAEPSLIKGNIIGGLGVFGASYTNILPYETTFVCCE